MSAGYVLVSRNEPLSEARDYSNEPSNPAEPGCLEMAITGPATTSGSSAINSVPMNEKPHVCFLILGPTGSGKSSFIAAATDLAENASIIGHSLDSHTSTCTPYRLEDTSTRFTLLDTPGFDDPNRDDLEILASITAFLSSPDTPHIAGILLTHNITVNRLTGSARLNQAIVRALCGERFAPRLILLTTMWDKIPGPAVHDECERREAQLLAASSAHWETRGYGGAMRFDGTREAARWVLAELMRTLQAADTAPPAQIVTELSAGTPLAKTRAGRVILDERERREKQREAEYQEELEEERERLRVTEAERTRLARQADGGGHRRRSSSRARCRSSSRTRRDGGFAGASWVPVGAVDWQYQAEITMAYGDSRHNQQQGYGGLPPVLPVDTSSRSTQDPWASSAQPDTALISQMESGVGRQTVFSFVGLRDRVGDLSQRWRWSSDTTGSGNRHDPSRRL